MSAKHSSLVRIYKHYNPDARHFYPKCGLTTSPECARFFFFVRRTSSVQLVSFIKKLQHSDQTVMTAFILQDVYIRRRIGTWKSGLANILALTDLFQDCSRLRSPTAVYTLLPATGTQKTIGALSANSFVYPRDYERSQTPYIKKAYYVHVLMACSVWHIPYHNWPELRRECQTI